MARFAAIVLLAASLSGLVSAAPLSLRRAVSRRAFTPSTDYASFQISSGTGGKAEAEANAVFDFAGVDLTTVSKATINQIEAMRQLAEAAETEQFNPAIAAASGAAKDALEVGKSKNKVLKLTAFKAKLDIQIAQGDGDEAKLAAEQTKLTKNIANDVKNAGKASESVTGAAAPAAAPVAAIPVAAAPVAAAAAAATGAAGSFTPSTDFASFQISSGTGGTAEAEANALFPFTGVDLATLPKETISQIETMRKLAEAAEIEKFNPAIAAATGAAKAALEVGKSKNKVLKLTAFKAKLQIQIAQGANVAANTAKLAEDQTKLTKNIADDVKNAGKASQTV